MLEVSPCDIARYILSISVEMYDKNCSASARMPAAPLRHVVEAGAANDKVSHTLLI